MRWFLGLGSNLGDREESLRRAVELLARSPDVDVLRSSSIYETDPVGGPEQPPYLNAVIEVETRLAPEELLERCLAIESEVGRVRRERWGPRVLDIDLLEGNDGATPIAIDEETLTVPHPRMRERAFVSIPLAELKGQDAPSDAGVRTFGPPLPLPR